MILSQRNIAVCLSILLAIVFAACEKHAPTEYYRITIINNSQATICPMMQDWNLMLSGDTSLPEVKPSLQIIGNGEEAYFDHNKDWTKEFSDYELDSVTFFFIDANTYQNSTWVEIRNSYNILKRVKYSVAELDAVDWVVQYP